MGAVNGWCVGWLVACSSCRSFVAESWMGSGSSRCSRGLEVAAIVGFSFLPLFVRTLTSPRLPQPFGSARRSAKAVVRRASLRNLAGERVTRDVPLTTCLSLTCGVALHDLELVLRRSSFASSPSWFRMSIGLVRARESRLLRRRSCRRSCVSVGHARRRARARLLVDGFVAVVSRHLLRRRRRRR